MHVSKSYQSYAAQATQEIQVVMFISLARTKTAAVQHQSVISLPLAPCRCHPCGPQDAYRTLAGGKEV